MDADGSGTGTGTVNRHYFGLVLRVVNFNWSGKQSLSTGVGLETRGGRGGGKGESTACVARVRACDVTGAPEALAVPAVA